ncbi:MAG TPA: DUF3667 domain-containing protein [Vicinamibacterales bacterium]|nr:DUF3667 domain-containing protein [Vicinamibacterales bacterium]
MTSPVAVCASCAQPLAGPYCSQCGEEAVHPHTLTVHHFIAHTLAHETLHVDGKIWRTLRYLFLRPGFLTAEYCAGRRRPYINPVRILITAIIAYTLLMPASNMQLTVLGQVNLNIAPVSSKDGASIADTVSRIDRGGLLEKYRAARAKESDLLSDSAREKFHARLHAFAQPLSFSNVLLLAMALFIFFHRKQPLFVAHGVFSMHVVSFVLLSSLLLMAPFPLLSRAGLMPVALGLILAGITAQFAYLSIAIRRFYFADDLRRFRPWIVATVASILLYVLNSAFITGMQMLGGALAIWSVAR